MSGLAALLAGHNPPDLYQWHSAAHVEDVQHAVEVAHWRFAYLDGWTIEDRDTFLKAATTVLDIPDECAQSFEALADGLSQVTCGEAHGMVFLWDGWSPLARHDEEAFSTGLSVLGRRVQEDRGGSFAVVLRGEGPPLDLPELPHKH